MASLRVLEYVRDPGGIWNLPRAHAEALARDYPMLAVDSPGSREEAADLLPGAEIVLGYAVRPATFARAQQVKWIHSPAAGVEHLLFPELIASAITLTNGRGTHAAGMAEHALGVMLAFARKLHRSRDAQLAARWDQAAQVSEAPDFGTLEGATLGLVGFGRVGSAIAEKARAFGMRVLAVRPHPAADPAPAHAQWPLARLHEMLAQCDWVVLIAPHRPETQQLIDAAAIAAMKPGARLMNLGRGGILDHAALLAALESGHLAGAALDVFEREPLPPDSPLWRNPEVIVTPHTSGYGPRYWERVMALFRANLDRYLAGEELLNVVDKRAGY